MSSDQTNHLLDADGAPIVPAPESRFSLPDIPFSVILDVGRMGVQFGIGLASLGLETAQRLVFEAIDRGAVIEKHGLEALGRFEREQVAYMKDYLKGAKSTADAVTGSTIEAHVEEALKTHDVPTRDDIRELNDHIAALDEKVDRLNR